MKLHNITIGTETFKIVCAEIFDTNDVFKAEIIFDIEDKEIDFYSLSGKYEDYSIKGLNIDMSDLEISGNVFDELYIDVHCSSGSWAGAYISVNMGRE